MNMLSRQTSRLPITNFGGLIFRAVGLLLALICALLADSRSRAVAQGGTEYVSAEDPRVQQLLADPTWCWVETEMAQHAVTGTSVSRAISEHLAAALVRGGHVIEMRMTVSGGRRTVWKPVRCPELPLAPPYYYVGELGGSFVNPSPYGWLGPNAGPEVPKGFGTLYWLEYLAATDELTNQGSVTHDPLGLGFSVGYGLAPWHNGFILDPFVSFDYIGLSVNQTFPGGSFLGTRSNFEGTGGIKFGPAIGTNAWVYGIVGASFLNETLTVNFVPLSSSTTTTVPGATLGFGGAIQPAMLQGFGHPVSVFLEYQHTWWQDARFNTPASSPIFDYTFRRDDDTIKLGLSFYFNAPAPPAAPVYPVKAPLLK